MLDDRPYMRSAPPARWPLAYTLMAVNVAVFVIQSLLDLYGVFPFTRTFALSLAGLGRGWYWQLHRAFWQRTYSVLVPPDLLF